MFKYLNTDLTQAYEAEREEALARKRKGEPLTAIAKNTDQPAGGRDINAIGQEKL
jgi:hypothetical protein